MELSAAEIIEELLIEEGGRARGSEGKTQAPGTGWPDCSAVPSGEKPGRRSRRGAGTRDVGRLWPLGPTGGRPRREVWAAALHRDQRLLRLGPLGGGLCLTGREASQMCPSAVTNHLRRSLTVSCWGIKRVNKLQLKYITVCVRP